MSATKPFLSVIIPVYNESQRLSGFQTIYEYLSSQAFSSELIIVNDGSTDDTLLKLQAFQADHDVRLVSYAPNRGKGYAIQQGMLAATGRYRLFADVDLSTPMTELDRFLPSLSEVDIVIGTRKQRGASILVDQGKLRKTLGKCFTFLTQSILQLPLSDFTCGFKCFSECAAEAIFRRVMIQRWGFDVEVLFVADKLGYSIREIPVTWSNDARSKVRFPHDIFRSLADLLIVRWNSLSGKYHLPHRSKAIPVVFANHNTGR
ncbi:MAG: glycosyltransferase family 2 protein [Nitrospirae bacterium]|nr:glycosyltransferase family 2 protein [Nitrospirota bacterium]